jgi:hypothetical protein
MKPKVKDRSTAVITHRFELTGARSQTLPSTEQTHSGHPAVSGQLNTGAQEQAEHEVREAHTVKPVDNPLANSPATARAVACMQGAATKCNAELDLGEGHNLDAEKY